jgi:DNA repair exonuclease SbcCD ATPase subunit
VQELRRRCRPATHETNRVRVLTARYPAEIYYFNFATGESKWEHPQDEHFKELCRVEREKLGTKQASSATGASPDGSPGLPPRGALEKVSASDIAALEAASAARVEERRKQLVEQELALVRELQAAADARGQALREAAAERTAQLEAEARARLEAAEARAAKERRRDDEVEGRRAAERAREQREQEDIKGGAGRRGDHGGDAAGEPHPRRADLLRQAEDAEARAAAAQRELQAMRSHSGGYAGGSVAAAAVTGLAVGAAAAFFVLKARA